MINASKIIIPIRDRDTIANNNPTKNKPVLTVKNDKTKPINKNIIPRITNKANHAKKNLIIRINTLYRPFKNLYSLCFGSLITILFFFSSSFILLSSVEQLSSLLVSLSFTSS